MKRFILLTLLSWGGVASPPAFSQMPNSPASLTVSTDSNSAIWAKLRQVEGLTVILMRHSVSPGTGDPAYFQVSNCLTQRNLSPKGRQQARQIGRIFREQKIPVARVFSSQWCRASETARLLDLGNVEQLTALNSFFDDPETASRHTEQLRQFMVRFKSEKKVFLMVTHQVNITAIDGTIPDQGNAVILRLNEQNRFQVMGYLDL